MAHIPIPASAFGHALDLFERGFNVFPQPRGKKAGYPWKSLQYTRLDPEHAVYGLPALFSAPCNVAVMCGRTSGNLFVIDCETPDSFEHHCVQMRARGLNLWTVRTARGGHVYLRCKDGEVASIEPGVLPDAEVRGARCYVLGAGSLHPSGTIYTWLHREGDTPPCVSAADVDWLTDSSGKSIRLKVGGGKTTRQFNPLSRRTQDYLANGALLAPGTRNNRLFAAACDMAGCGYAYADAERLLLPLAEASGLPRGEVLATLHSAYARVRQPARPNLPPIQFKPMCDDWECAAAFAETYTWVGRKGASERSVFEALVTRCQQSANEKGVFRASMRELAQMTRMSINTVEAAITRLKTRLIFYCGRDEVSGASLWRFTNVVLKANRSTTESLPRSNQWKSCSDSIFDGDALERGALGRTGWQLWSVMRALAVPAMPSRLARESGLAVHQVNYALAKMKKFGVVERLPEGWQALELMPEEVDRRAALAAGTVGKGEARRRRFARQRALFAGRILYHALLREGALCVRAEVPTESERMVESSENSGIIRNNQAAHDAEERENAVKLWQCPNCGQAHFGDYPPDMCDFCRDFTTWRVLERDPLDDPLVQFAMELGADVYVQTDDGAYALISPAALEPPVQLSLFDPPSRRRRRR